MRNFKTKLAILAIPFALIACGDSEEDKGEGTVQLTSWGEEIVEEGIPADEFADGWAVEFENFIVTIKDVKIGGVTLPDPEPVDLAESSNGKGHKLTTGTVPGGEHTNASFVIAQVDIKGSATKDEVEKTFDWSFDNATAYTNCDTTTTVEDGKTTTFQVTIHADHIFANSLVDEELTLEFARLADADADEDGEITKAELEAADPGDYDAGNIAVDDLWSWLEAAIGTIGHVDGEGHCDAAPLSE